VVSPSVLALPCGHATSSPDRGSLCIPIAAIGKTIGLFHVVGAHEEARALALSVADRVGLALSNLMLRSDLRQLSIRDPLTGLYNRRYMEETLEIETHRAERKETTIGVIMLDIDHFKAFNDGFGHAAGDELLRALGGLVLGHLRAGDIACRYGGEEFVLILPEATADAAHARAEDLRQRVKTLNVQAGEKALGPVSISLGVAVFPLHANSRDALLAAADACLYRAKGAGRDRVVVAGAAEEVPPTPRSGQRRR
jgi:diguanylate cyclase (GGDEF)-like protein